MLRAPEPYLSAHGVILRFVELILRSGALVSGAPALSFCCRRYVSALGPYVAVEFVKGTEEKSPWQCA